MSSSSSEFYSSQSSSDEGQTVSESLSIPFQNDVITPAPRKIIKAFSTRTNARARSDYLTICFIRSIERAIRSHRNNRIPSKTAIKVDPLSLQQSNNWLAVVQVLHCHSQTFDILFPREGQHRTSYNLKFFKEFFEPAEVKELHLALVRLIYSDPDPSILISRFGIFCCREVIHSIQCQVKWDRLHEYLKGDFLRRLSL
jgi:hypothetical protein